MTDYSILPDGVSNSDFDRAIEKFRATIGDEQVIVDVGRLAPYRKIMLPVDEMDYAPSGVLMASSVEEIQRILVICNEYRIPVWTISTGRNFGYGSAMPATRGQMILDLRRMNRIIEIDPVLCTALVEPGVTYKQLQDYLKEHNIPLWLDVPSPGPIVGPMGNTLERGAGYTPYGDHFMVSCGMEVVLANGEILRTAMGGVSNSNTWQVFKWGYGPYLDGIFTQSNFGIVTKLGFWLMPAPPVYKPFGVQYDDPADIEKAIEVLRPLRIGGVIPNGGLAQYALYEIAIVKKRAEIYDGPGAIPEEVIAREAKALGLGIWNIYSALYGTEEQIAVNWKIIEQAFGSTGGRIVTEADFGPDNVLFQRQKDLMSGQMTLVEFGAYNFRPGGGSLWFAPLSQARGSETIKQTRMAREILGEFGFDYLCAYIVGMREMHHIIDLLYDRSDAEETRKAYACFDKLLTRFAEEGYGTYRTNIAFMDKVAETYGPVQRSVNQKIKRALDPNGILAPGKSGIHI